MSIPHLAALGRSSPAVARRGREVDHGEPRATGSALDDTSEHAPDPWGRAGVELGAILDHYRLIEVLATDGPIASFRAEHTFLGRPVVVKVLSDGPDRGRARAFLAEATALWQLAHPSFPAVLEYGADDGGRPYVIMELLAGTRLAERMAAGPLPPGLAIDLAQQVTVAMAAAHGRGVAHGALGAEAIYLCPETALAQGVRVKIADFAAGVPTLDHDSTSVAVERAIRAARPSDDVAAIGALLAELLASAAGEMPAELARALAGLAARMEIAVPPPPSLMAASEELRRLGLELDERGRRRTEVRPAIPVA